MAEVPFWLQCMDGEDLNFIKRFLLFSGSLKQLANEYDVTYPTIRLRLDRLIEKIKVRDEAKPEDDSYTLLIKELAVNGEIARGAAKKLIAGYKKERGKVNGSLV